MLIVYVIYVGFTELWNFICVPLCLWPCDLWFISLLMFLVIFGLSLCLCSL
ncbi:hypothetical protein AtNW77_Chr5g0115971 [Arabidopsis thaliana]